MEISLLLHRVVTAGSALFASGEIGMQSRSGICCSSSYGTIRLHSLPPPRLGRAAAKSTPQGRTGCHSSTREHYLSSTNKVNVSLFRDRRIPKSTGSSSSNGITDEQIPSEESKTPFGYTRKDVLLIGVGVTILGVGLKSGLEFAGVDPLQAGNVIQLVLVLGLTVGWIGTYIFRVSNKDMTYAQQLRDYEKKVMEKRLESLSESELQVLLEQVEEEKTRLSGKKRE